MRPIHIIDHNNRNARVGLLADEKIVKAPDRVPKGVRKTQFIRGTEATSVPAMIESMGITYQDLSQKIMDSDPEVDISLVGKRIDKTHPIYLIGDQPAHNVVIKEYVYALDGSLRVTRDFKPAESNINLESPVNGRLVDRSMLTKFAFGSCYQLSHTDGISYDYLYSLAGHLQDNRSVMLFGAKNPMILHYNGTPYRGLLEGRIKGEQYMLLMHLTNLELKRIS